ncbi:MAG: hypothetical protein AB7N76_35045 [Planctomycetota bacterium]
MSDDELTEDERQEILREVGIDPRQARGADCPSCDAPVHAKDEQCQNCGHPLRARKARRSPTRRAGPQPAALAVEPGQARPFRGPPYECRDCGGALKKGSDASAEGIGCIVTILGLVLVPLCLGIPVFLYGLNLILKREGFWRCRNCGGKFPREVRWYELG